MFTLRSSLCATKVHLAGEPVPSAFADFVMRAASLLELIILSAQHFTPNRTRTAAPWGRSPPPSCLSPGAASPLRLAECGIRTKKLHTNLSQEVSCLMQPVSIHFWGPPKEHKSQRNSSDAFGAAFVSVLLCTAAVAVVPGENRRVVPVVQFLIKNA